MWEGIRNIVFDLGGVMIDLDRERCVREFHQIGFSQIDELLNPWHPQGPMQELERGAISEEEFYDAIRGMIGASGRDFGIPSDEAIRAAYLSFLDGIPVYKLRMVRSLRKAGMRTYALSNISSIMFPHIRDRFFTADGRVLSDYFEKAYLSFEMRMLKPAPEIYREMVRDSGMAPEETLFIDDNEANVSAARELGFQVYMPAAREDFRHIFD